MAFHNLNLQFADVAAFTAWLATQQRPQWDDPIIGSTYHNTFIPNAQQWRGRSSMLSMQRTYAAKTWDRGPHVYLALGTAHDGIFVMTPPWLEGIHSPSCNGKRFGIENVGDFQSTPMSNAQLQLLTDVAAALHRYAGIVGDINAHRDCDTRTCPGDAAYAQKGQIQLLLAEKLTGHAVLTAAPLYTELSPLLGTGLAAAERIIQLLLAKNTDPNAEYQEAAICEIVGTYLIICDRVGLNDDLVLAQMIYETDWLHSFFAVRPRRNPATLATPATPARQLATAGRWNLSGDLWRFSLAFSKHPGACRSAAGLGAATQFFVKHIVEGSVLTMLPGIVALYCANHLSFLFPAGDPAPISAGEYPRLETAKPKFCARVMQALVLLRHRTPVASKKCVNRFPRS